MAKGWAVFVGAIGVSVGFLAGFLSAIRMNPATADRYVLSLGSVGEWVSGIGALAAVVTAVVIAEKQRRENMEQISFTPSLKRLVNVSPMSSERSLVVDVVSTGNRPARIIGAKILNPSGKSCWVSNHAGESGKKFPIDLNYGEGLDIWIESLDVRSVLESFDDGCSKAKMVVNTTLGSWDVDVSQQLAILKKERNNPEKSIFD
ncbi:hypothetical protein [Pseudomonas sp.]|uniref:hypothetical protein n=1 Tax=Pseudomonas sp. TaxID=306 RepID=UPI0028B1ED63|nr:hypothetical protein [Pseudomonas sp.]